jgi:hypothetical protein
MARFPPSRLPAKAPGASESPTQPSRTVDSSDSDNELPGGASEGQRQPDNNANVVSSLPPPRPSLRDIYQPSSQASMSSSAVGGSTRKVGKMPPLAWMKASIDDSQHSLEEKPMPSKQPSARQWGKPKAPAGSDSEKENADEGKQDSGGRPPVPPSLLSSRKVATSEMADESERKAPPGKLEKRQSWVKQASSTSVAKEQLPTPHKLPRENSWVKPKADVEDKPPKTGSDEKPAAAPAPPPSSTPAAAAPKPAISLDAILRTSANLKETKSTAPLKNKKEDQGAPKQPAWAKNLQARSKSPVRARSKSPVRQPTSPTPVPKSAAAVANPTDQTKPRSESVAQLGGILSKHFEKQAAQKAGQTKDEGSSKSSDITPKTAHHVHATAPMPAPISPPVPAAQEDEVLDEEYEELDASKGSKSEYVDEVVEEESYEEMDASLIEEYVDEHGNPLEDEYDEEEYIEEDEVSDGSDQKAAPTPAPSLAQAPTPMQSLANAPAPAPVPAPVPVSAGKCIAQMFFVCFPHRACSSTVSIIHQHQLPSHGKPRLPHQPRCQ